LQPSILAKRGTVLLFLAVVAFYFYGLGHIPFVGPDEPRYAQVAREMLRRHDLITPTLGGLPWFEKPALLYWMMIASFKLFGVSEWAARLPAALSGLITLGAVYCLGNRIERAYFEGSSRREGIPLGFCCALAAATMIGIVVFSRAASFDILLTMTTTCAFTFYVSYALEEDDSYGAERGAKHLRWYLAGFYVFVGLSLLAKGLIGLVIAIGVLTLFYLFQRKLPTRKTLISVLWGLPLALIVAGTWYVPVVMKNGWPFIDQFFIQHHFARYVSNKYRHHEPIYYYLVVIPLLSLPWTVFLVAALRESRHWLPRRRLGGNGSEDHLDRLRVFALAWLLFPLVFFSFSGSKLPGYILPVLPAIALLVGERLWRLSADHEASRRPIRMTGALCFLFAIGVLIYARSTGSLPIVCALLIAASLLVAAFSALFSRAQADSPDSPILILAGSTLMVLFVSLRCIAPQAAEFESSKRLLQLANARGYSQALIYGMQRRDRTPEFYAAGRIVYGADGEPIMYEAPDQVVAESKRRGEVVLAFVPVRDVDQLTGMTAAQTEVIGNNGRYAIVAVRPR
jgi:4-amino-4-deoxy-L-arabinose transferase-like glycosyltransferase